MEYITVANGIITGHFCGKSLPDGAIQVPDGFPGWGGLPVAALTSDYSAIKPLAQQASEGVITIPEGHKINEAGTEFTRKSQEELDSEFPVETWAEVGSFNYTSVHKAFNNIGILEYTTPAGLIKMSSEQPAPYYKASEDGSWIPDIAKGKKLKLYEVNSGYDSAVSSYMKTYPEAELLTFDKQEKEAREWTADNRVSTPFLDGLAKARGIDKADLVSRVIKKAEAFQTAISTLTGVRQKYEDEIDAATTVEELEKIVPVYELL